MSHTCNHCDKTFTRKYSLTRHVRNLHDGQIEKPNGVTRLSFASEIGKFASIFTNVRRELVYMAMSHHFTSQVYTTFHAYVHIFKIEFDQWKEKMETETRSSFYKRSSKKAVNGGMIIYYRCVRNGFSRKKTNPRDEKRKNWMKGSCKAGERYFHN